jgi:hypothetical protein
LEVASFSSQVGSFRQIAPRDAVHASFERRRYWLRNTLQIAQRWCGRLRVATPVERLTIYIDLDSADTAEAVAQALGLTG